MTLKFIYEEPEEGTSTLGVVYHVLRKQSIRETFEYVGLIPPKVLGYVVDDNEETKG